MGKVSYIRNMDHTWYGSAVKGNYWINTEKGKKKWLGNSSSESRRRKTHNWPMVLINPEVYSRKPWDDSDLVWLMNNWPSHIGTKVGKAAGAQNYNEGVGMEYPIPGSAYLPGSYWDTAGAVGADTFKKSYWDLIKDIFDKKKNFKTQNATQTDRAFIKFLSNYLSKPNTKGYRYWKEFERLGLTGTAGAAQNLKNADLDKKGWDKLYASTAQAIVKKGGKIGTFAFITTEKKGGETIGLKLYLHASGQNKLMAEFEDHTGKDTKTAPSTTDQANYKAAAAGFEYFFEPPYPKEVQSPTKMDQTINPNLSEFQAGWMLAWGKEEEKGKKNNLKMELKGNGLGPVKAIAIVDPAQRSSDGWAQLNEFAGNKNAAKEPCSSGMSSQECAKAILKNSIGPKELAKQHMAFTQIYYVANIFNYLQNLNKDDRPLVAKNKDGSFNEDKKAAENVFKKLKKTMKDQTGVGLKEGNEEAAQQAGKQKIDAPELSKEEIEASQRANMQCALLMNLKTLSSNGFDDAYSGPGKRKNDKDVVRVFYSGGENKDQNQVINKLLTQKGSKIEPFMNITPEIASAMMPMIRLFKIRTASGKLVETEFAFDSFTNQNPDRKTFTLDDIDRGDGVGIKEFSWSFHGGNPALSRKDIKAKLVMYFQTFQDFIKPRNGGKYRFVDLMLFGGNKPGKKAKKMGFGKYQIDQYDPSYYRIRADVGWSIRNDENFKDLLAARDFNAEDAKSAMARFNSALENINQSLFLNMVEHNIDIRKDGTVMVTAEYQAYIESATKTNVLDSLSTPALLTKRKELNEMVESVLMTKCKGGKAKSSGTGTSGRENLLNSAGTVEELYMETAYQSVMKRLIERNLINVKYIKKEHIDTKDRPGRWSSPPVLMSPAQAASIIKSETTSAKNKKKKDKKGVKKNAKEKKPAEKPKAKPKAKPSKTDKVFKLLPPDSKLMQLNYFYVNDLVDVILDAKGGIKGEPRPEFKKTKVVLGSFEHDGQVVNIGAIPVSTQYFFEWFTDNVISKKLKTFPVMTFIRSLTNHLINDMLHEACVTEKADVSIEFRTTTAFGMGSPLSSKGMPKKSVNSIKPLRSFIKDGEDINNAYHYIIVYAMKTGRDKPHSGRGDATSDGKRGIHHLHIGQNRGIVKHISFEKTDIQYAREARYMRHGFDGLGQIGAVYNAKIEMIGNTIFYPGMLLYIDPIGIGGRGFDPTNIRSEANALGFGGYHLVTKADCSITPSGYNTTVTAMFNYSGEPMPKSGKKETKEEATSPLMPKRDANCNSVISKLEDIINKWHEGNRGGL